MTSPDMPPPTVLSPVELRRRVEPVLEGLVFPALRWQVVTAGELYGCDAVTRALLQCLPERPYRSLAELVGVLAAATDPRAVPARADAHVAPPAGDLARRRTAHAGGRARVRPSPGTGPRRPVAG